MRYACMSNLHPDTQLPINPLFRASGFIPVNIPLIAMLALLPPTVLIKTVDLLHAARPVQQPVLQLLLQLRQPERLQRVQDEPDGRYWIIISGLQRLHRLLLRRLHRHITARGQVAAESPGEGCGPRRQQRYRRHRGQQLQPVLHALQGLHLGNTSLLNIYRLNRWRRRN